jgi:hypothetical protein
VIRHNPDKVRFFIGTTLTVEWSTKSSLWLVKGPALETYFSAKTFGETVDFLCENKYIADMDYGQIQGIAKGLQPMSIPNSEPAVWDLAKKRFWDHSQNKNVDPKISDSLIKKMSDRDSYGVEKYGTRLQPHNGRSFIKDLLDELLDAIVYAEGALYEIENKVEK